MTALPKPQSPTITASRVISLPSQGRKRYHYGALTLETVVKVTINSVISVAAIAALSNLIPYLVSHQAKLREIRTQVRTTELKVNQLQDKFSRSFDPSQASSVMQEQSARVSPNQRRVVWVERPASSENSDRALE
ncbi:MAG: hypothetical protein SAJ12_07520 [Jaaginema sp. PMC 1079.18]|nr:hypothetical protein [Jaaginema sp. PMC 1080.18]MEC4850847.1 hypothetical protein [Jaaginema sp. PMC 1079.18]MEC4867275.1 hypothetical protein [Jaaginema sp. PMC 1078.18]